jgi:hypothetical protein
MQLQDTLFVMTKLLQLQRRGRSGIVWLPCDHVQRRQISPQLTTLPNISITSLFPFSERFELKYQCVVNNASAFALTQSLQSAAGKVSCTIDGWSVDTTKASFLGITGHWIDVVDGQWILRSEVLAFRGISGQHTGENLGRYFFGLAERVGIITQDTSKVCKWSIFTCQASFIPHTALLHNRR